MLHPDTFSAAFAAAVVRRRAIAQTAEAVRLLDGAGDQLPDIFVDRLGPVLQLHCHLRDGDGTSVASGGKEDLVTGVAESALEIVAAEGMSYVSGAVVWLHPQTGQARLAALVGTVPQEMVLHEHGLSYLLRPARHVNAGFFVDMRLVRQRLMGESEGKRVLNCFCFTGSLGITAWSGGAAEVVQLDISQRALSWCKENRDLNGAAGTGIMRFIKEDCLAFVEREVRRAAKGRELYDIIIIDPPSFGRGRGKVFNVEHSLPLLISASVRALRPAGTLVVTTNDRSATPTGVSELIHEAAEFNCRRVSNEWPLLPPDDFTARGDDSVSMRGCWAEL